MNEPVQKSLSDRMIDKCETILRGLNVTFYIRRDDGMELTNGNIVVKPKEAKSKRNLSQPDIPYGSMSKYLREMGVDKMKEGQVLTIPKDKFNMERLRGCATALAANKWGKGTMTTNILGNTLEVMRHSPWSD
jgi:long-subunit acyl-CoA synthetase (AMP-forming)